MRCNHSCRRFLVWQWQQICDQISKLRLYYIDSGIQHHNKDILSSLYSQICAGLSGSVCFSSRCADVIVTSTLTSYLWLA